MKTLICILLLAALGFPITGMAATAESGETVLVIFNKKVPESKQVAEHYARLRRVPDGQVIGYDLPTTETMTRTEFTTRLQKPLFDYLVLRGIFTVSPWETAPDGVSKRQRVTTSGIRYAVLCYGVPLRILPDETLAESGAANVRQELRKNGAAVDSELALLPLTRQTVLLAGLIPNPFYGATGTNVARIHPTNGVLMVTRLDGPTPEIARGLADKAGEAERTGLWGRAYFDARGITNGSYAQGDSWIRGAAELARRMGYETTLDLADATFPESFPMSQIALYAGWYAGGPVGPFARAKVEFMPGAFAYHLHSFSAHTVRSTTANWVGPLLAKGATATIGYVDEPYLATTCELAVFMQNFLHNGASFGEAAYAAERALSWQTTVVGDPLYRPFGKPLDLLHYGLEQHHSRLAEWSHVLVMNRNIVMGIGPDELITYAKQQTLTEHSAVLTEKLGDLFREKKDLPAAAQHYQLALDRQPSPLQKVRLLLTAGGIQTATGQAKEAIQTYQRLLKEIPDYPDPLGIWKRILPLAQKLPDKDLTAKCEEEIKRLTPPPPTPAPSK